MDTLLPVAAQRTLDAVAVQVDLLPVGTLWSAFGLADGLPSPGGLSQSAHEAEEFALLWLVFSVSAGSAEIGNFIEVLSSGALFLAF